MKRMLVLMFLLALAAMPAMAQNGFTTVSGTITDPNGIPWAGGTISAQLVTAGGPAPTLNGVGFTTQTSPVQLDSTGHFLMLLADNGVIVPSNTTWRFTVNIAPGVLPPFGLGPQSFIVTTAINCGTNTPATCTSNAMNITAALVPVPALTVNFGGAGAGTVTHTGALTFGLLVCGNGGADISICNPQIGIPNPMVSPDPQEFQNRLIFDSLSNSPWIDVTAPRWGMRMTTTQPTATVSSLNSGTVIPTLTGGFANFVNRDSVVINGAGPACSLATPTGITAWQAVDTSASGTGIVTDSGVVTGGATVYGYQVIAEDYVGCLTAASTVVNFTSNALLGRNTVGASTLTLSGNTVTVVAASPMVPAPVVNELVYVGLGTGDFGGSWTTISSNEFIGWFKVASATDSTHFTLTVNRNSNVPGTTTSATGGTLTWTTPNHIKIPHVAGARRYYVYGSTGGAANLLGQTTQVRYVGVQITAASLSGNVVSLTVPNSNSTCTNGNGDQTSCITDGVTVANVQGFQGADAFLNGNYTIISHTTSTITYALTHANYTAAGPFLVASIHLPYDADVFFDDYGSGVHTGAQDTLSDYTAGAFPAYVPATAPGSSTPEYLLATIQTGGGTANPSLSLAASTTASGTTMLLDEMPLLMNIWNNTTSATSSEAYLYLPPSTTPGVVGHSAYWFASYGRCVNFDSNTSKTSKLTLGVAGPMNISNGGTLDCNANIIGLPPYTFQNPQFNVSPVQTVSGNANPMFYSLSGSPYFEHIFTNGTAGNQQNNVLWDIVTQAKYLNGAIQTGSGASNDYLGIGLMIRGDFDFVLNNNLYAGGACANVFQDQGCITTPVVFTRKRQGITDLTGTYPPQMNGGWVVGHGGLLTSMDPFGTVGGVNGIIGAKLEYLQSQNAVAPIVMYSGGSYAPGWQFDNFSPADFSNPLFANWGTTNAVSFGQNFTSNPNGSFLLTGFPVNAVTVNHPMTGAQLGQNFNISYPTYGTSNDPALTGTSLIPAFGGQQVFSESVRHKFGSDFFETAPPAAPAATPAAGGSLGNGVTITYQLSIVYLDGGVGRQSIPSAPCVTTLTNQTCNVTWTKVDGVKGYNLSKNTIQGSGVAISCNSPQFSQSTTSYSDTSATGCGNSPAQIASGGPTSGNVNHYITPNLLISEQATPPTCPAAGVSIYVPSTGSFIHIPLGCYNGGSYAPLVRMTQGSPATPGHVGVFDANGVDLVDGGLPGGITLQVNGVNNSSQTTLNNQTSTTNSCGMTNTPSNPSAGNVKMEITGTLNAGCGGTGLANPAAHADLQGEGSSPVGVVGPGKTGQYKVAQNGADPSYLSPGIADGNSGSPVTTTPYPIACDSATTILDRAHILRFQSGAAVVTVPDSTASGCTGNFVTSVIDESAGTLTFNRSGADTFSVSDGGLTVTGGTSFTLSNGQYATLSNGAPNIWEVRKTRTPSIAASAHLLGSDSSSNGIAATQTDESFIGYAAGGGTAQAQTITLAPAILSLTDGLDVCWKPTAANSAAAPTLAVNGLTATTITKLGNTALVANDITTSAIACAVYNSSGPRFELQNPQTTSAASSPVVYFGTCNGTAVSAGTTTVMNLGGVTNNGACTGGLTDGQSIVITHACTAKNLYFKSIGNGVNGSDGVVTLRRGSPAFSNTTITCTAGTGNNCNDTTHTQAMNAGDQMSVQIVTQTSSTLSGLSVSFECQ